MSQANTTDMTQGKPLPLITRFALPLIAGNLFQQFYSIADAAIVGKGVGIEALAALGAADWTSWLMLWVVQGLAQGFAILIAQRFGAQDALGVKKSLALSAILSVVLGVGLTAIGLWLARPTLLLLKTPSNILPTALQYLHIIFGGTLAIMAYNMAASVLRALGDSKSPLIALVISTVINIGLDLVFVFGFSWGVQGAAVATVIAQVCSFVYCLRKMWQMPILQLQKTHWQWRSALAKKLLHLGVPIAISMAIIAIGGMFVQSAVNQQGFLFVAGFTATNKLYGVLESVALAFSFALSTYVAQNFGAQQLQRLYVGVKQTAWLNVGISFLIAIAMILWGKWLLRMFISSQAADSAQVLAIAYKYLFIMSCFLFILYLTNLYRTALQGLGHTKIASVSGAVELLMRALVVMVLPHFFGNESIFYAEVAAWTGATVYLMACFYWQMKLQEKRWAID